MKKSEIYRNAQIAVITSQDLCAEEKLEILRELISEEKLARFSEEREQPQ